jgi:hypothetical protein
MPGASEKTRRVKALNVNWVAGKDGDDGRFEAMIVTEDDEQHTIAPSPASMTALLALAQPDNILLWDPTNRTLIAANVVGKWLEEVPRSTVVRRWSPE